MVCPTITKGLATRLTVTSKGKGKAKSKRKVGVTVVLLDKMQTDVPKNKERIELERAKKICKIFFG